MDQTQYTTLMDVLTDVPDPRMARGQRHAWPVLLTLLAAGLASGQQTARAISQWVAHHATVLQAALPAMTRLPSESTVLRTLRQIDVTVLEAAVAQLAQPLHPAAPRAGHVVTPLGTILHAHAVDGKVLRGATACGASTHLVSDGSGRTLAQAAVAHKRSKVTAVPVLLRGRDLTDTVLTMDALLTQRAVAQQIIDQHG